MKSERISIPNSSGHQLSAYIELPANQKPSYLAVFAHCFTCSGSFAPVRHITRELTNYGFGVVRFDFTGLGKSGGEFSDSHFSANVQDLVDVCQYISQKYIKPTLLIGHSLGGAAAIVASHQLKYIRAVATIGAPSNVGHVKHHFEHKINEVLQQGQADVKIGGRPFVINKEFVEGFNTIALLDIVKELKKPILIMHSPFDKIVGIEHARELYHHAYHPKSFISLDQADHLLTSKEDSVYVGNVIGAWVKKYYPSLDNVILDTEGEQLVGHLNLMDDEFTTSIQTKTHALIADEPIDVGGDDFGPSPYELLVAGLAACTTMTLKLYANRKKWDLKEVYVYLTHSKKHMETGEDSSKNKIDFIEKKLKFIGDLTEDQRQRLLEISAKCPVHRTLTNGVKIQSSIME
ncbi:bifunctional alpha/beta hydrolase/OsmC family protein [Membranihabitans marinus]|uniref:bifunctional alpha/beta hydrolase/OsmC family protein n=1 Tax=Membranihabitans marinus TaxID=1227546 RepID=UPI001F23F0F5|nr:bifunctional alpha/beta hydrolase/OsmC family protein [Membranihabitans marinus]